MSTAYYTDTGNAISLDGEVKKGGEGTVYLISGNGSDVAKIYHPHKRPSMDTHQKLLAMVKNPPDDPTLRSPDSHRSIAWPSNLLYSDQKKTDLAGFIMPKININDFLIILNYMQPEIRQALPQGPFTWKHLYNIAINLSSCVAAIHERGYCIGDINESNVLVKFNTYVTLIDCDSFQIKDDSSGRVWRCPVGKPEYTAPEIMNRNFSEVDRTEDTDNFALAVLIFQLLMEGFHPYAAEGHAGDHNIKDTIIKGIFPYTTSALGGISPPNYAPPFEILHQEIRDLFVRCFVAGHKDPSKRPSAREWWAALKKFGDKAAFLTCSKVPTHQYLNHLQKCPWCERLRKLGWDSFDPVGVQKPLPVLQVTPLHVDFGTIQTGGSASRDVTITNAGGGTLDVRISTSTPWISSVIPTSMLLGQNQSRNLRVTVNSLGLLAGSRASGSVDVSTDVKSVNISAGVFVAAQIVRKPKWKHFAVGLAVFLFLVILISGLFNTKESTREKTLPPPPPISTPITNLRVTSSAISENLEGAKKNLENQPMGTRGIETFSPGAKNLCYYVSYSGAVPNKTKFRYRWFKSGTQIAASDFTVQYANGNAWTFCSYNFEPGDYNVRVSVDGVEKDNTPFTILASSPSASPPVIPPELSKIEQAPEPMPAQVQVMRSFMAADLDSSRRPVGPASTFTGARNKLVYFVQYENATDNSPFSTELYRYGRPTGDACKFKFRGSRGSYSCSFNRFFGPGDYTVRLIEKGKQIDEVRFTVQAVASPPSVRGHWDKELDAGGYVDE